MSESSASSRIKHLLNTYSGLVLMGAVGIPVGVIVGAICALFGRVLLAIGAFRDEHITLLLPFFALMGLAIVFAYHTWGKGTDRGMSLVFDVGHGPEDAIRKARPVFHGVLAMQSARTLFLVRALKPKQPLLAIKPAGISVERTIGGNYAMAWHDDRNGITRNRSPHRTRRHNRVLIPRNPVAGGDTKRNLAIRSDLTTRNCKQLVPNFTLKRRANHMQRRRKPRLLPRKISIQPSPRTLKHRRSRAICRTYRRHATSTGNRIGACNTFGVFPKKRRAKMLLTLKPKPRQTAAISGKQDFAQR